MESLPQERLVQGRGMNHGGTAECEDIFSGAKRVETSSDARMLQLAQTIEREIIPRLMLAHRAVAQPVARPQATTTIGRADVEEFAKLVLSTDEEAAFAAIGTYRAREVPIDMLYLHLLAPTARYLGELWDEDLCNFSEVTVGLGRLQRVLRELSPEFGSGVDHPVQGRRILLLPSPGEQHTFGLVMVAEFFRRAGWDVAGGAWMPGGDARGLVGSEWFDVVGFSLASELHLDALADIIRSVRHAACNRDIAILVGGPMFGIHPEFVERVGADGMTTDGQQAPLLAERMIVKASSRGPASGLRQQSSCNPGVAL